MKNIKQFPTSLFDITIEDYLFLKTVQETFGDNESKLISEVCKYFTQGKDLPIAEAKEKLDNLIKILKQEPRFIQRFEHKGVEYGLIPNLERMTTGEYSDIEMYSTDINKVTNLMSVFYRPIVEKVGDMYVIEPYEGSHKYANTMREVPVEIYLGLMVFFYDLSKNLLKGSLISSQKALKPLLTR